MINCEDKVPYYFVDHGGLNIDINYVAFDGFYLNLEWNNIL